MTITDRVAARDAASLGIPKMAAIGAAIGFVVVFVAFMFICTGVGADRTSAAVISLFAALWGGPGFGALMGAVWAAHPPEER